MILLLPLVVRSSGGSGGSRVLSDQPLFRPRLKEKTMKPSQERPSEMTGAGSPLLPSHRLVFEHEREKGKKKTYNGKEDTLGGLVGWEGGGK